MKITAPDNPIVIVRRPQRWADLGKLMSLQPQYPSGSIKSALKRTASGIEASTGHEHSIFQFRTTLLWTTRSSSAVECVSVRTARATCTPGAFALPFVNADCQDIGVGIHYSLRLYGSLFFEETSLPSSAANAITTRMMWSSHW